MNFSNTKRYYLHGDLYELDNNKYYCALCDAFESKEHFYLNEFHSINNQVKYLGSLERFKKANVSFRKNNFRPKEVINLFKVLPKKNFSRFYRLIKKQKERDDPIGDLAKDVLRDESFPIETNSYEIIKKHLLFKLACDEAIQALKEAFDEFKLIKGTNSVNLSLKLRFEIFKKDNYCCRLCGASPKEPGVRLEVDHIIPKSKGGTNDLSNLWTLCFKCNRGKGTRNL